MIIRCCQEENIVFDYIGDDYPYCLYLYLDLKKYGFDSDTVDIYIQRDGSSIQSVLLKYYTCLHFYSKDNSFDIDELSSFIVKQSITMVYCMAASACLLYEQLVEVLGGKASITKGWLAQIKAVDRPSQGLPVLAKENDFDQIVKLIYDDEDIGRSYNYNDLAKQLEERNKQGYTRNLVIKQNDLVIAHACTNAELDNIAVVAELLVRKEFRRKGYASEIWRDICGRILSEGKDVYSFYFSEESRSLHQKIGFHELCRWGKIVIDQSK